MRPATKDMTKGNPTSLLLTFMLPLLIGNIFQQLYNMVDSIVVGRLLGADALAAVGSTGSLFWMVNSVCIGLANGVGVVISQFFGAEDRDGVENTIANSIYIIFIGAALMTSIGLSFARPILVALNTPEGIVLENAVIYFRFVSAGVMCVALYNGVASILRALGDSKSPLYFLIFSSIVNTVLDIVFIANFKMGVEGAALATIISQFLSGTLALAYAIITNPYFKIKRQSFKIQHAIIARVIKIGLPMAFQSSLIAFSCIILQSVVNTYGAIVMATFTATSRIEQLIQQPFMSLGTAVSTFTAQNIGARKIDRVKEGYRKAWRILLTFTLVAMPLIMIFGKYIINIFVTEEAVIAMGTTALRITAPFYIPLGAIYISRSLLNGAGDAAFSFINGFTEVFCRISFVFPLCAIPFIGSWGIWFATGGTWLVTGIVCTTRYLMGKWKHIHLI